VFRVINCIVDDSFIPRFLARHPWEVMNLTAVWRYYHEGFISVGLLGKLCYRAGWYSHDRVYVYSKQMTFC